MQNTIDTAMKMYGLLDIPLAHAGVSDMPFVADEAGDTGDAIRNGTIDTNLTAPTRAIHKTIPVFEKQKGCVTVNMAFISGYTGAHEGGAACVASVHSLTGPTKNAAYTCVSKNIRCNAVAPGKTATKLRASREKPIVTKTVHNRATGCRKTSEDAVTAGYVVSTRAGHPDEIAKAALLPASVNALASGVPCRCRQSMAAGWLAECRLA